MSIECAEAGDGPGRDPAKSVGEAIHGLAKMAPDAPALLAPGLAPCSFRDLAEHIESVGAALHACGFGHNSRVGLSLPSAPAAALAMLAVGSWAQAVPLDPNAPPAEVERQLAFVHANAVLVPDGVSTPARAAAERLGLMVIEASSEDGRFGLDLATSSLAEVRQQPVRPSPDSILYILQTSGTTADPKHVLWTHRNQLAVTERVRRAQQLTADDRALIILPIHHSFGVNTLWTAILTGGSVAFPSNPLRFDLAEWFGDLRPTWYRAVPAQHLFILEHLRSVPSLELPRCLRLVVTGAAAFPDETRTGLRDVLGFPVFETYGCSEAGFVCGSLPIPGSSKIGSVGRPDDGVVLIVDEQGAPSPVSEQGEILIGGPTVSPGYVNAPDLNREAFSEGWYRTGDVGSLDEDGFLTLCGRLKEVISRGAEKIYPHDVEEILRCHPQVLDAAVFGIPHERLGEEVAAAVVVRPGTAVRPAELRRFLGTRLAWSKIPRRFVFVSELPKGANGKVMRRSLQQSVGQWTV